MQLGVFENIGIRDVDGGEGSLLEVVEFSIGIIGGGGVTSEPATVDFGTDGVLSPDDTTEIVQIFNFSVNGSPQTAKVIIEAIYTGTDSDGSVHFDPTSVDVEGFPPLKVFLEGIAELSELRATNAEPFPASAYPATDPADLIVCFATGTLIATPDGEKAVEHLQIGDSVLTEDGRAVPVKWIGRQVLHKRFTPKERFCPVKICMGALGEAQPHCDLVVTPDHGILINGMMINAGALVNGRSIFRVPVEELAERVTYYHVETEMHDVILANGAPAETFVDYRTRRAFENYAEYEALFGKDERNLPEMTLPRAMSRRQVPGRIALQIEERAHLCGFAELREAV